MKFLSTLSVMLLAATVQAIPSKPISGRKVDKKYIFASFHAENQQSSKETTGLNIYTSNDGINFDEYAMDAYKPEKGVLRDPSIIEYWGRYYVAYTTGWSGTEIGIISSEDLKSWKYETTINVASENFYVKKTWAPEFFWDPKDGSINIIVSLSRLPTCIQIGRYNRCEDGVFKPYIISANNGPLLQTWTMPPREIDVASKESHIDMFVVYNPDDAENHYHAFMKNEEEKYVEHLTAQQIEGPYKYVQAKNFAGWGPMEGPAVTRHPDGKQWILYADNYKGKYFFSESPDLFKWSGMREVPNHSKKMRHGTVLIQ